MNGSLSTQSGKKNNLKRKVRLIAKLDVKPPYLVKGIQLEGLRQLGEPNDYASNYYKDGIDEIIYEDVVASLFERNSLSEIIKHATQNIFIPITVGGGLRSIEDVTNALRSGADKISLNTAAIKNNNIITEISKEYGSSTIVVSIQAKKSSDAWEAYYDNGRERTYLDAVGWAQTAEQLGAGELLVTSVDKEGTGQGFDINLVNEICSRVQIPVIANGGCGNLNHIKEIIENTDVDAIAIAKVLHYNQISINEIKQFCLNNGIEVRKIKTNE